MGYSFKIQPRSEDKLPTVDCVCDSPSSCKNLHIPVNRRQLKHQSSGTPTFDEAPLMTTKQLLQHISRDIIGAHTTFRSPFGVKAMSYADYTASGKALQSIEDFIRHNVLPLYGNTHTTTSATGLQTTSFREEARQIIAGAVNANTDGPNASDCVLFTGPGSTSAINKLVTALGLHKLPPKITSAPDSRPVVFVGPFEHHSNILPWRESGADVIAIPEDKSGHIDVVVLERKLQQFRRRPLKIGSFSAASNLTGILTDVDAVTSLLHQYGALSFWDYAACAPYVNIDMNPSTKSVYTGSTAKDAVFLSGHKLVGGPNTPGVLIVKKKLLPSKPTVPGGGTVLFVTEQAHQYLDNVVEREEGGTPDIIGSIRLGLAFQLKERVGSSKIMEIERRHVQHVRESLSQNPNIVLLGRDDVMDHELPIFSFLVRYGDRFLHYNFVCALLNDLFGIQTRGGCQCAGPYGARLLGLSSDDIVALGHAVAAHNEALKPGFSRMSFPYFMEDAETDYILDAVHFVASQGWKFLPMYAFDRNTGAWYHRLRSNGGSVRLQQLSEFSMGETSSDVAQELPSLRHSEVESHRSQNMSLARTLARQSVTRPIASFCTESLELQHEGLRWFVYPSEVVAALRKLRIPALTSEIAGPCQPQRYLDGSLRHEWSGVDDSSPVNVATKPMERAKAAVRRAVDFYVCSFPRKQRSSTTQTESSDSETESRRR